MPKAGENNGGGITIPTDLQCGWRGAVCAPASRMVLQMILVFTPRWINLMSMICMRPCCIAWVSIIDVWCFAIRGGIFV